jgi:hypothetical protein
MTESDYLAILDKYVEVSVDLAKQGKFLDTPELAELADKLDAYQASATKYQVVCKKAHYAGQGIDWQVGDVYDTVYARTFAENYLQALNKGWSVDCWEIVEIPPA